MIRLASWIVFSLVVSALIAWLIALPGTVTLEIAGWRMQPRLGVAVFIVLAAVALIILVWGIVRRILATPRLLARRRQEKRRQNGVEALSDAFIALEAGDPARARSLARDAQSNLPGNPAAQLLEARAELAMGDMAAAREHYRALISERKTALAALSGLYDQARTQGRPDTALTFARKAIALAPGTVWASDAVFDDLTRRGEWAEALQQASEAPVSTREERAARRRRQAVLETAIARDAEATDPNRALDHALNALKLLPNFVPAALIAARIHSNRGEARRAMSLLRRVWRATGHPDAATLYANAVPGASAVERLKRVRELIDMPPETLAGAVVVARAAIDAYEWSVARNALAVYAAADPSQAVCSLMAEIEEGQSGDQGKARQWLARAVRAPRDPQWTADGITADEWEPVSPVNGRLDAFEWKVPVSAVGPKAVEARAAESPEEGERLALPHGQAG
ncbi:heme biosynthesis protein HemY [Arsenicitalea aurantiaca]|uniref:Heme biosynthesis protein HemY n=1 Tax=Arsenicitalea aurantiaca TaxID=1783274 RepID=A0A433X5L5_9HYPH|nr:heme biosynthesis HemY N-terminal domain-containing protein [Arsenicitalea aurantiaca]RUT29352.1 heme biosynthesis protein HemY [Arsenicitalea aurantiaca]